MLPELAIELVDRTDWPALAEDPKWFVGWSDISTLLLPLTITTGVATLHGANLMDEPWELPAEFRRWTDVASLPVGASFTQSAAPHRRSRPWDIWEKEPLGRDAAYEAPTVWRALSGDDDVKMRGRLIGGCLETVSLLAGSRYGDVAALRSIWCHDPDRICAGGVSPDSIVARCASHPRRNSVGCMEFVVFYATKDPSRLREVYPRHHAYVEQFAQDGGLVAIGTFDDPVANGSMAVFASRDRAEEFLAHDPFVTEDVVDPSAIREWNVLTFR